MDGPGRMKGEMEIQAGELYPHHATDLGAELHSPAKPEKLKEGNEHLDPRCS